MRKKYKRGLTGIGILIAITIMVGVAYLFYDKMMTNETDVVVIEELSVNFMNGYNIKKNGDYTFSITNNGEKEVYYEILVNNFDNYQDIIKYSLISQDASVNITNAKLDINSPLTSTVLINPKSTQNFTLKVSDNEITSFKLEIRKIIDTEEYFYTTILKNNEIKNNSMTKVLEEVAVTDEGLIEDVDDLGLTYYFRGAVKNNYVTFAGLTWRIVRINGDGTVKLVLDSVLQDLVTYHDLLDSYENFQESTVNKYLNSYYDINLSEYDNQIANTKYCVESNKMEEANNKIYNGYTRLITDKIPTFNCLGSVYTNKIGLVTADEVIYAGANFELENTNYYLYIPELENVWWTSTLAKATESAFYPFTVGITGKMDYNTSGVLYHALRPTITLNRKVVVTGTGTFDDPYVVNSN